MKAPKLSTIKKKADKVFSEYIRRKYANTHGDVKCVTCGQWHPIAEMDAGHYISRNHMATRYDERNVFPQCHRCNRFNGGNIPTYSLFLLDRFGLSVVRDLEKLSHEVYKWDVFALQDKIEEWKSAIKNFKKC